MLALPIVYQQSGWLMPTVVLIVMCCCSSLCATFLCDTISRVPGNSKFEERIEFETVFHVFMGPMWGTVAQVMFVICLMSQCIASIIDTAQVLDGFVVYLFGTTYGLEVLPVPQFRSWSHRECNRDANEYCSPFQDGDVSVILTVGYMALTLLVLPMGCMNLNENIAIQIVSFTMLGLLTTVFVINYCYIGLDFQRVPMIGPPSNWASALGTVVFNYAYIILLPSWVNEKKPEVSVNKTVWYSGIGATVMYILMGWLGAAAFPDVNANVLDVLVSPHQPAGLEESHGWHQFIQVCAMLFAIGIIGLGIPIFCIMMRYNLLVARVASPNMSLFWGNVFPYLVSWLLYQGNLSETMIEWTGNTTNAAINFLAPLVLTIVALSAASAATSGEQVPLQAVQESSQRQSSIVMDPFSLHPREGDGEEGQEETAQGHTSGCRVEPLPAWAADYQREVAILVLGILTPLTILGAAFSIEQLV